MVIYIIKMIIYFYKDMSFYITHREVFRMNMSVPNDYVDM